MTTFVRFNNFLLYAITLWTNLIIRFVIFISVIEKNLKVMKELGKLAKTVGDILECRIEAVLEDMSSTALCELPEEEPVTMEKFLEITNEVIDSASKYLAK